MMENYEIQDINDMAADERLPMGVVKWTNTFAEVSR